MQQGRARHPDWEWNNKRACRECGNIGYSLKNCPLCNTCVWCKRKGHLIFDCERAPRCPHCGDKGHKPEYCLQRSLATSQASKQPSQAPKQPSQAPKQSSQAPKQLSEPKFQVPKKGKSKSHHTGTPIVTFKIPPHDAPEWLDIAPDLSQVGLYHSSRMIRTNTLARTLQSKRKSYFLISKISVFRCLRKSFMKSFQDQACTAMLSSNTVA